MSEPSGSAPAKVATTTETKADKSLLDQIIEQGRWREDTRERGKDLELRSSSRLQRER